VSQVAYLDASAVVKLVVPEPESAALAAAIRSRWPYALASEILAVEVHRAAMRAGGEAPVRAVQRMQAVALLPLTIAVRDQAQRLGPPELRALDALHLATALSVSDHIGALLTYDARLATAARAAGLTVESP